MLRVIVSRVSAHVVDWFQTFFVIVGGRYCDDLDSSAHLRDANDNSVRVKCKMLALVDEVLFVPSSEKKVNKTDPVFILT